MSTPCATVAIPVYNGEDTIERAITSASAQTFRDTEILVLDNASTDKTRSICERLAEQDPRIRYERNSSNIGLLPNFNRSVGLARGRYLRWLGAHDWLAPEYLERCVPPLEADAEAIGASCWQAWVNKQDGVQSWRKYDGPRVVATDPAARFCRMLKILRENYLTFDPIYSLLRKSSIERTNLFPLILAADTALAMEMSLIGPFVHVPELLSFRTVDSNPTDAHLFRVLTNSDRRPPRTELVPLVKEVLSSLGRYPLTARQRLSCRTAILTYAGKETVREGYFMVRKMIGRVTGLSLLKRRFSAVR